ncbi:ABC transporter permease [Actinopolymorpha alba]|uniref:ABC transporter permease n=1 Tax=Actinopolymorpha alba TaxID=533267 RepID=UPI00035E5589|nr:ABC transporter permease [Actinopolymorpha alba]
MSATSTESTRHLTTKSNAGAATNLQADQRQTTRRRTRRRLAPGRPIPGYRLLGPVLLLAAWVVTSAVGILDARTLSPPWTVVTTAGELIADGRLQSNLTTSLTRAVIALVIGVAAGVVLALAAGLSRIGEALIDGPVQIKRAIPSLALIPLAIIWFGIGEGMKVTMIVLSVFVPVYINTHASLRGIDSRYAELAETVGLRRWEFIWRVALPGSLPGFFTGLRISVTVSWLALVVVEQINATSGIGYLMSQARNYGQTDVIVVGLVVYALFGLASDTFVRFVEGRVLSWRRTLAG